LHKSLQNEEKIYSTNNGLLVKMVLCICVLEEGEKRVWGAEIYFKRHVMCLKRLALLVFKLNVFLLKVISLPQNDCRDRDLCGYMQIYQPRFYKLPNLLEEGILEKKIETTDERI